VRTWFRLYMEDGIEGLAGFRYVSTAGFIEIHHYFRPMGLPRAQQPWLATVLRKPQ
ncbi:MAG: hypothetical protein HON18_03045, partial [Rhodospirillaceae bacterium]|nr:hypothetical protein [Rhodospirillaceae bacterium]